MDDQRAAIIKSIADLVATPGWQHLKRDFQHQIDALQEEINQPGGNEMKYSEGDLQKVKMKFMKDLLNYPKNFADSLIEHQPEDEDPYNPTH